MAVSGGPIAAYEAKVAAGEIRNDPDQRAALGALNSLSQALETPAQESGFLKGLFRKSSTENDLKGLYLWGGVGRGKSMIMDIFFDNAPVSGKRRVHFHAFMQDIHDRLRDVRATGERDPLRVVATDVTDGLRLLCFDELQITDITDAMIVGRLFEQLFEAGVIIVTTSNRIPEDLYKDGLNRKLFLPFIDMLNARLDILHLDSETDHRRAALQTERLYIAPLGASAEAQINSLWARLAGPGEHAPLRLSNKGREVLIPAFLNGAGRGRFSEFCEVANGPSDFLLIAEACAVLFIEDIPQLNRTKANEAKRFVTLIDALYEAETRLIVSAAAEPEQLYEEGPGAFEFERTASRLIEMCSGSWPAS